MSSSTVPEAEVAGSLGGWFNTGAGGSGEAGGGAVEMRRALALVCRLALQQDLLAARAHHTHGARYWQLRWRLSNCHWYSHICFCSFRRQREQRMQHKWRVMERDDCLWLALNTEHICVWNGEHKKYNSPVTPDVWPTEYTALILNSSDNFC